MIAEVPRNGSAYQLADHVRSAIRADSGVVLDIERGRMFRLNHVASRMLELVKRGLQEPEIMASIAEEFGIDFKTAAHDVRDFLDKLNRFGVIEERPAKTSSSAT